MMWKLGLISTALLAIILFTRKLDLSNYLLTHKKQLFLGATVEEAGRNAQAAANRGRAQGSRGG